MTNASHRVRRPVPLACVLLAATLAGCAAPAPATPTGGGSGAASTLAASGTATAAASPELTATQEPTASL